MNANAAPRIRSAMADRMGFAWTKRELPTMTVEEAREILRVEAECGIPEGRLGNEDTYTLWYAALLASFADNEDGRKAASEMIRAELAADDLEYRDNRAFTNGTMARAQQHIDDAKRALIQVGGTLPV